jgi:hypothetical protein
VGAGVLGAAIVVLLALTLLELRSSHAAIDEQKTLARRLLSRSSPVLRAATPLAREVHDVIEPARSARRDLSKAAAEVPGLAISVRNLAGEGAFLLKRVNGLDLEGLTRGVSALSSQLTGPGVLPSLLTTSSTLVQQIQQSSLIDRIENATDSIPTLIALQRRVLGVQVQSLRRQTASLRVQRRSLTTQRKTLRHVRSVDRRLGGTVIPGGR